MIHQAYPVTVALSRVSAPSKEASIREVRRFRRDYDVVEITTMDLARKLVDGHMMVPADLENQRREGFLSSELLCLDIENTDLQPETATELLSGLGFPVLFGYHTYSSTPESPRYRLVLRLSVAIDDLDAYEEMLRGLHKHLAAHGLETDKQTLDGVHVYFGGHTLFHEDHAAVVDVDLIPRAKRPGRKPRASRPAQTDNEIAEAIKHKDVTLLRSLVDVRLPDDFQGLDLIDKLAAINISDFFKLPAEQGLHCLFHEDKNPSAGIKHTGKNEMYKCFSCGRVHNIVTLVADLMDGTNAEAVRLLEDVLQVRFTSDYQRKMMEAVFYHEMNVVRNLREEHTELASWMERSNLSGFYLTLLRIGAQMTTARALNAETDLTFFVSSRKLVELMRPYGIPGVSDKRFILKKLNLLAEVGLVVKEADVTAKSYIKKATAYKRERGYTFRTNYLTIPMHGNVLNDATEALRARKEGGVRNMHTSSTQLFNHDREKTGAVYSQSDIQAIGGAVERDQQLLLLVCMQLIEDQGFFSEHMLRDKLMEQGFTKYKAEKLAGAYRPFLLDYFELLTVSKETRREHSLPDHIKARMKVYVRLQRE
ncbi:CHC2 zinc finger domain-containing protein [Exiguobacterium aurantiacum]|uniref:CHC2 zinc finger domain-containing protein n=1 Tax=Exiguobacterium aurantiacum TaxID=33987 RepID=UPI00384ED22B